MIKKLPTTDPYSSLCKNLYSVGIFDQTINGLLSVIEKDAHHRTILVKRSFINNSGGHIEAGYYFIQCLNYSCAEEHLREFRGLLEAVVKQRTKGNYMEVDPILVAPVFSDTVLSFVDQHNKIQRRKPIQVFTYGE